MSRFVLILLFTLACFPARTTSAADLDSRTKITLNGSSVGSVITSPTFGQVIAALPLRNCNSATPLNHLINLISADYRSASIASLPPIP